MLGYGDTCEPCQTTQRTLQREVRSAVWDALADCLTALTGSRATFKDAAYFWAERDAHFLVLVECDSMPHFAHSPPVRD